MHKILFGVTLVALNIIFIQIPYAAETLSKPLVLHGTKDKVITGLRIENPDGVCIQLVNCENIRIEKCVLGPAKGEGVAISDSKNVTVVENRMEHVRSGVYAHRAQGICVEKNYFKNIQGPFPRGQFVQFDKVSGGRNRVNDNFGENVQGQSNPEDAINMYKSSGTESDPIQIMRNKIRGGGPSGSGGGIMTGDDGGGYIIVKDNILVDPGQYGIAIASGTHIQILDNQVYAHQQPFTNVGIYVWNQYAPECAHHVVRGNKVNWTNRDGVKNPAWNAGNCGTVEGWDQNEWNAAINASILPSEKSTTD
ncbi:MAG TPA: right-handed parallel beta-helix repeat-containing protein [Candidatus Hydrogenedentes bacterium]|nr:right-handed parallel beta-helix repeat-containing protein [Candidatus Hydrogenedentota bacterium]